MSEIIGQIIPIVAPAAWPLIIVILGCVFIYLKIQSQRKVTKSERDNINEEFDLRLTLCEHDITFIKEQNAIFADKLDRILSELTEIKVSLAKKAEKL